MSPILQYHFNKDIKLYNLGDIHRGNRNCNVKFLQHIVGEIQSDPLAYWVSTGDMLEVATSASASSPYKAISTQDELELLIDELTPIADKCLGFVASNHHRRVEKQVGLSLDSAVARGLKIPFLGITGAINVTVGRACYYCILHHGVGGGTKGNKINRAAKLAGNYQGADIYFTGHTHTYSHVPFYQTGIDRKRGKFTRILSHMIVTGHCLEWEGSYAEEYGLEPSPVGFSVVELKFCQSGNERRKRITPYLMGTS